MSSRPVAAALSLRSDALRERHLAHPTLHNPYLAPSAGLSGSPATVPTYRASPWALKGRIGRLRYIAYSFGLYLAVLVPAGLLLHLAFGVPGGMRWLNAVSLFAMAAVGIVTSTRRVNDLGHSGWLSLLILLPLINILFWLWLALAPGKADENRFGPAPGPNSVLVKIGAAVAGVLGLMAAASMAFAIVQFYMMSRVANVPIVRRH